MSPEFFRLTDAVHLRNSAEDLGDLMLEIVGHYQLNTYIISSLPTSLDQVRRPVLLSNWSPDWYEAYRRRGYVQIDPVARYGARTTRPFAWSESLASVQVEGAVAKFLDDAVSFGMLDGYCVPIHMEAGTFGVVSFSGDVSRLDQKALSELELLAFATHNRLQYLTGEARHVEPPSITGREAEVLRLVAVGKTAVEIAEITGLKPRTINQHCENAQRRLGTRNRVHTVIEAIRQGLIDL